MIFAFVLASIITGVSGLQFATNIHPDRTDGQWANYAFTQSLIRGIGFRRVRSPLNIMPGQSNKYLNFLMALDDGDKPDAIRSIQIVGPGLSSAQIIQKMGGLWGVDAFEGPNEDCNANWVQEDRDQMTQIAAVKNWPSIYSIAPSMCLGHDPAQLAGAPINRANAHIYGTRMPENLGWGPDVYGNGTSYGSFDYEIKEAQRAVPGASVVATEIGYDTAPGKLDEYTQASYIERAALLCVNKGVQCINYDLEDDSQQYGFARVDGSLKPSAFGMQGLVTILSDTGGGACSLDATITSSSPVMTALVCHPSGEKDLAVWVAAPLQDPDTFACLAVTPVPVSITVAGVTRLYAQTTAYHWFWVDNPNTQTLTANERPFLLAVNPGPKPTFPVLPGG